MVAARETGGHRGAWAVAGVCLRSWVTMCNCEQSPGGAQPEKGLCVAWRCWGRCWGRIWPAQVHTCPLMHTGVRLAQACLCWCMQAFPFIHSPGHAHTCVSAWAVTRFPAGTYLCTRHAGFCTYVYKCLLLHMCVLIHAHSCMQPGGVLHLLRHVLPLCTHVSTITHKLSSYTAKRGHTFPCLRAHLFSPLHVPWLHSDSVCQ